MKNTETRLKPASRAIWKQRYQDWKNSGLSQAAFCKQNNLKPSSFYNWIYIFRQSSTAKRANAKSTTLKSAFIPVNITPSSNELTLCCGDITLRCVDTVSAEQLCQWAKALRKATC